MTLDPQTLSIKTIVTYDINQFSNPNAAFSLVKNSIIIAGVDNNYMSGSSVYITRLDATTLMPVEKDVGNF